MSSARDIWPLFDLTIRTPRLELRVPTDEQYATICDLAVQGIHPPETMPFAVEWTDQPPELLRRSALQFLWGTRANWTPESWHLEFAVYHDGVPIGMKALWADDFPTLREFATGSWLGAEFQGRGFGKEMRAAVLHLAFHHLGAQWAISQVFADNPASLAVNRHHGYREDGLALRVRRGKPADWLRFRLSRTEWQARGSTGEGFTVDGWDECAQMFAAGTEPGR